MRNSTSSATQTRIAVNPTPPALHGSSCSASDESDRLIAQARRILGLKLELIAQERALYGACRAAGIEIADVLAHAHR